MKRPLPPWGKALEDLRQRKDISQPDMAKSGVITPGEYYRMCRAKTGPRVQTLDSLLSWLGYTWRDWADAFESAKKSAPISKMPTEKGGTKKLSAG